jgi:hypothetical protein
MADVASMPQKMGATAYGQKRTIPSDTSLYALPHLEGTLRVFRVKSISDKTLFISNSDLTVMLVRNAAAAALLPGRLVTWAAGYYKKRVDGYARTDAAVVAGVVDPYLPSAGVRVGDLFWLCLRGPTYCKTPLSAGASNLIPEGTVLVALTGATSGATTSGRVAPQDLTGATAVLGGQLQNKVGVALSAKTTANTNVDILVDLQLPW